MTGDSILLSVKKILGIEPDYTYFDVDLIIHINSVLSVLYQLGVGKQAFSISDSGSTWSDFLGDDSAQLNDVKTYVALRVRLLFDPPTVGAVMESLKQTISELEWRINVTVDPGEIQNG